MTTSVRGIPRSRLCGSAIVLRRMLPFS
ncbi:hypothetical protein NQ318_017113 [Aromia moschata]|uniref:Uncharacterized protein n=1 Tax=Aromia moschata TaxID=1265417 RepID=A0AAV8Y3J7_9CUCU|nr:hypothetical protein NQ318_017113 [Aromia moschata]